MMMNEEKAMKNRERVKKWKLKTRTRYGSSSNGTESRTKTKSGFMTTTDTKSCETRPQNMMNSWEAIQNETAHQDICKLVCRDSPTH